MQHFAAFAFLYKQATPLPKFSLWNNPWFQNFMQLCPRKAYYLVCCSCSCKYAALCCNCRIELASNSSAWVLPLKQSLIAKFHPTLCKEIGLIHYAATAAADMQQYAAIDALYKQATLLPKFSLWNNPWLQNFIWLCPRNQYLFSMMQLQLQLQECSIMPHLLHCISKLFFYLSSPFQKNLIEKFPATLSKKTVLFSMLQLQLQVCSIMLQLPQNICKQLLYLSSPSETISDCKISCNSMQGNRTYSLCCSCSCKYAAICCNWCTVYASHSPTWVFLLKQSLIAKFHATPRKMDLLSILWFTIYTAIVQHMQQCAATWYFLYFELFLWFRPRKKYPLQKADKISAHFPNFCLAASEHLQIAMQLQLLQLQNEKSFSTNMFPRSF